MSEARRILVERLAADLIGPESDDEMIADRPTDRYLTGILHPAQTLIAPEEDDDAGAENGEEADGADRDSAPAFRSFRPSAAGISFAVRGEAGGDATVRVSITAARYLRLDGDAGKADIGAEERSSGDEGEFSAPGRRDELWKRRPLGASIVLKLKPTPMRRIPLSDHGIPGMALTLRVTKAEDTLLVTAAITNEASVAQSAGRKAVEEACFFQTSLSVEPLEGTDLVGKPRPKRRDLNDDEDMRAAELLYRSVREYAVGHTCSAQWDCGENGSIRRVRTSWIPEAVVPAVKPAGHAVFDTLNELGDDGPLSADWLSSAPDEALARGLVQLVDAYDRWIQLRVDELTVVPDELRPQGELHVERCREAAARMRRGADLVGSDGTVRRAFRLANRAIALQNSWKKTERLRWRPFQLGFALLSLTSLADGEDPDRETMDLLWFPTGGGKTEAYLLLTAFAIFHRRLAAKGDPGAAGVTVFMRYTLRLLTVQQFERAAALICACDLLRTGEADAGEAIGPLGLGEDAPISIGLWVGGGASPNKVAEAIDALANDGDSTPAQVSACPACHSELEWSAGPGRDRIEARCTASDCILGRRDQPLPVWTVDEDVFRELPSLVIGTVDKYAQIVRKQETGRLFGIGVGVAPPDLIIQDELHLISGPLGTLAGLYEVAVDELCRSTGRPPKVIGSTATIRRAASQIRGLFDREAFQFPPPGLDQGDSGFAVIDEDAPGRLYVGVTTAGRSAKFTLQAVVASLLQSAKSPALTDGQRDAYWSLVAYFNSLRELGGALVLMRDDVERSIAELAGRRGEPERSAGSQIELTSRIASSEIPVHLKQLEARFDQQESVDIALASNMISVGMDVSRLGLMVVNGQPKTMAEYIQATSRVGRDRNAPGLVLTVYNAGKARDRSRYESFVGWHDGLYREVEATSVTPFAPRARDRALHAPFVAIVRHLVDGMDRPGHARNHEDEIWERALRFVSRIRSIDPDEATQSARQLERFMELWLSLPRDARYWDDWGAGALLTSAEAAAERRLRPSNEGLPRPTPNSLRTVEPSTPFVLLNGLSRGGRDRSAGRRT